MNTKNIPLYIIVLTVIIGSAISAFAQEASEQKNLSQLRPKIEGSERTSLSPGTILDNFDNIVTPSSGAASVYPSVIDVGGLVGTISDINVTLYNINHTSFNNLDVMLVAPDGTSVVFLSDVDYSPAGVTNLSLSFDDSAANRIPLFSSPSGVTFKPSAYMDPGEGGDFFAAPAPAPMAASELNVFNGRNPNGVWRLYVMDDTAGASGNIASGWRLEITTAPASRASRILDFDGDGKTDYVVARNLSGQFRWYLWQSAAGYREVNFGSNGDTFVPADYDGDGKTDFAVWGMRPEISSAPIYYILRSSDLMVQSFNWGLVGDDPRYAQDFDGDGRADPTVARSNGTNYVWYTRLSTTGAVTTTIFGGSSFGDVPVRGDFDGDGKADIAVYRSAGSAQGTFYVLQSSSGSLKTSGFGRYSTDFIVPADFDGDGVTDFAVWRGLQTGGDSGTWYWKNSRSGTIGGVQFGNGAPTIPPDWATPGDYDGDGKTDQSVWRKANRFFYVNGSGGTYTEFQWGVATDRIVSFELQVR